MDLDRSRDERPGWHEVRDLERAYNPGSGVTWTLEMYDSYGDGWNGNSIDIIVDGVVVLDDVTLSSGSFGSLASQLAVARWSMPT